MIVHLSKCKCKQCKIFNFSSGFKKKVTAMSKLKDCESLQPWIKSLCNHLYWVPASTPSGHGQLMLEKWQSVCNHVQNINENDGDIFSVRKQSHCKARGVCDVQTDAERHPKALPWSPNSRSGRVN